MRKIISVLVILVFVQTAVSVLAEQDVTVTAVMKGTTTIGGQKIVYPKTDKAEMTSVVIEIQPGKESGRHMHPVPTYVHVLEGCRGRSPPRSHRSSCAARSKPRWRPRSGCAPAAIARPCSSRGSPSRSTLGEQGPFDARGVGAVLLSSSGERAPAADAPVSQARLTAFGRAALRSIGALDESPDVPASGPYVLLERKVLPAWSVRLLALVLVLPVLLAAVDALARVRRRRERVGRWLGWVGVSALPFVLAALVAIGLFRVGLLDAAPQGPVAGAAAQPNAAALASVLLLLAVGWLVLRRPLLRLAGMDGDPGKGGAATAIVLVLCAVDGGRVGRQPVRSPAAGPGAPRVAAGDGARDADASPGRRAALRCRAAAAAARRLRLCAPVRPRSARAAVDGRAARRRRWHSFLAVLVWCVVLGCAATALVVVLRVTDSSRPDGGVGPSITMRGPKTYAGPGSLGGTESALRR